MFSHRTQEGFTGAVAKAGLAIGSTTSQVAIAAPNGAGVDFAINGIGYHKADVATVAITAAAAQAADTTCIYLVQLNAAGALSTVKGAEELNTDLAAGNRVLHWPAVTAGNCPIGAVKIKTIGVTFTAGATALNAAGVTATYYDFIGGMPVAPLTA